MDIEETKRLFYVGIQGYLKSWTAFQLAVMHGFGGPHSSEKAQWMVGVIQDFFQENDDIEPWELENFIAELLSTEFNTVTEDNSTQEISVKLCNLYQLWVAGNNDEIMKRLRALPCVNMGNCISGEANNKDTQADANEEMLAVENLKLNAAEGNVDQQQQQEKNKINCTAEKSCNSQTPDEDGWVEIKPRRKRTR